MRRPVMNAYLDLLTQPEEIRALLEVGRSEQDLDAWARDKLSWDVAGSSKTS